MRKIEKEMLEAVIKKLPWSKDNTRVTELGEVYLYGNYLGYMDYATNKFIPTVITLLKFPTNTTKSRLRALGVDVTTRKGITYLDGQPL